MNIDLIILAGGFSSRMGVFKPLLPVDGIPAIMRCIQTGKEAGIREIVVVTGFMRAELERALQGFEFEEFKSQGHKFENSVYGGFELQGSEFKGLELEIRLVHNENYVAGMFSSVVTGVKALNRSNERGEGFFLLPADCCTVSSNTLITLASAFTNNDGKAVIRPKFDGRRGHPPLIPAGYASAITKYSGNEGLKAVLRTLPSVEVEMDSDEALHDMDTPEDYSQLLHFLGLATYPTTEQCVLLLSEYGASRKIIEHGEAVAALACELASFMNEKGADIDVSLLRSASLLHDICRSEPEHASAGMKLLLKRGFPEAAILIGEHMQLHTLVETVKERELLYLADKLCRRERVVAIDETIDKLSSKFAENPKARESATERMLTASIILNMIKEQYGDPQLF